MNNKITSIATEILNKYPNSIVEIKIDPNQLKSKGEHRRSDYHLAIGKLNPAGKVYIYEGADRDILTENYLGHIESINKLSDIEDIIKTPTKVFTVRKRRKDKCY